MARLTNMANARTVLLNKARRVLIPRSEAGWLKLGYWTRLLPIAIIYGSLLSIPQHAPLSFPILAFVCSYTVYGFVILALLYRQRVSLFGLSYYLITYFIILIGAFSLYYWVYGFRPNFNMKLTRFDATYFAMGTFSTAGTGNLVATSELARAMQFGQIALDLGFAFFAVTLVVTRFISSEEKADPGRSS